MSDCISVGNDFMKKVRVMPVEGRSLGIFWLGQAGFLLKTPGDSLIAVDPYLSDICERMVGFKRITPSVMKVDDFRADYLFLSHEHPDHFDTDLLDSATRKNDIRIFGSGGCLRQAMENGLDSGRITRLYENRAVGFGEFTVLPVKADHGDLAPDALGFIFDFGFIRVYFSGDTAYSPGLLTKVIDKRPEIALLPINGEYGNMNAGDAAQLAADIGARVLIPCHYWTFIEHGSNPLVLMRIAKKPDYSFEVKFLAQGEGYVCRLS